MKPHPVCMRLAELETISKARELNPSEKAEVYHCLDWLSLNGKDKRLVHCQRRIGEIHMLLKTEPMTKTEKYQFKAILHYYLEHNSNICWGYVKQKNLQQIVGDKEEIPNESD